MKQDWFKYNKGLLSANPPHVDCQLSRKDILSEIRNRGAWFARYTTGFDSHTETEWWYCLKDSRIELTQLSAKQRYRIKHGMKNCTFVKIDCPSQLDIYICSLYAIEQEKRLFYPSQYRTEVEKTRFENKMRMWLQCNADIWVALSQKDNIPIAYSIIDRKKEMVWLTVLSVSPTHKNTDVNAALVYTICNYYIGSCGCKYVCDGERNIRHITNFQDFLVKNLNFRYAYCNLHIVYLPWVEIAVKFLFPLRNVLSIIGKYNRILYNISSALKQEAIARKFR